MQPQRITEIVMPNGDTIPVYSYRGNLQETANYVLALAVRTLTTGSAGISYREKTPTSTVGR